MKRKYHYTRDLSECIEEAKKELGKRYQTTAVTMLALQKWHDSIVYED